MKTVSIYTTPSCTYCRMAKEFFKEHNIAYSEFDVAADPVRRGEMVEMTGQLGVPVIRIDNTLLVGFNRVKVSELLDIAI
ncbi:MAG: NrdH-redoxin [Candidatus Pacebacteria bacterium]|nr:NrdH-redoxin [Candidatus Paceibacterota bacterium]MBP9852325.1 NrdH-redoxin [Candidatus Paceibacterota bacterium]